MIPPPSIPHADYENMWKRIRECAKKLANQGAFELFAAKAGIPESTFHRYATGKTTPTLRATVAIAAAADVHLVWLATGVGPRDRNDERIEFARSSCAPILDLGAPSQNATPADWWGCIRLNSDTVSDRRGAITLGAFRFDEDIPNWRYHFGETLLVDLTRKEPRTGDWCLRLATGAIVVRSLVANSRGALEVSWPRENGTFESQALSHADFRATFQLVGAVVGHLRSTCLP
jgi:hypothetical protein